MKGFLAQTFELASWLFTNVLILNLYGIIKWKVLLIKVKYMHLMIWTILILLAFLPFATGVYYGTELKFNKVTRCSLYSHNSQNTLDLWFALHESFALFTIIFISLLTGLIYYHSYRNEHMDIRRTESESWQTMMLYPLSLLICWIPSQAFKLSLQFHNQKHKVPFIEATEIENGVYSLAPLHGLFLSLIFYFHTIRAKDEWMKIFTSLKIIKESNKDSNRESNCEMNEITLNAIRIND